MNTNEAADMIQLISTYDDKATPKDDNRAKLKAHEWALQLDQYPADQVTDAIRDHYRQTDTTITIAALRHYLHDKQANTSRALQRRQQRAIDKKSSDIGRPPADLLDRTNQCPTCNTRPGNPCQPLMSFGINHIERNPVTLTKHNQHADYERMEREGRTGVICECCGQHTRIPA